MSVDTTRRWFKVPGDPKPADRTLEEQMLGLDLAIQEALGKTVLDLGCAEGMIAFEFAKAGAASVLGVEVLDYHLEVARRLNRLAPSVEFVQKNLNDWTPEEADRWKSDVVLALAVIHKLRDPKRGLELAARAARDLIVFRWPEWYDKRGVLRSKNHDASVNVPATMLGAGFKCVLGLPGPRGEPVEYWRRVKR